MIESNESFVLGSDVPEHQVQKAVHLAVKYQASVQLPEQAQHVAAARPTIDLGIFLQYLVIQSALITAELVGYAAPCPTFFYLSRKQYFLRRLSLEITHSSETQYHSDAFQH
ncbi:Uncharacterised protein [Acinetobacter baumannii]|nr:Uncharacterised protein [Acinetobacter baumannii]